MLAVTGHGVEAAGREYVGSHSFALGLEPEVAAVGHAQRVVVLSRRRLAGWLSSRAGWSGSSERAIVRDTGGTPDPQH